MATQIAKHLGGENLWQSKTEPATAGGGLTTYEFSLPGEELSYGKHHSLRLWKQPLPWVSFRNNLWQLFNEGSGNS